MFHAPNKTKAYSPRRLYALERNAARPPGTCCLRIVERVPFWYPSNPSKLYVRYDNWHLTLHPETELRGFLRKLSREGFILAMTDPAEDFSFSKTRLLPFVVGWINA